MKKLISLLLVCAVFTVFAQTNQNNQTNPNQTNPNQTNQTNQNNQDNQMNSQMNSQSNVPNNIRMDFDKNYPGVNATWKSENGYYNAYYTDAMNQQHTVEFDKNGKMVWHRSMVSKTSVPQGISDYYTSKYPNEKDYAVWQEENPSGVKTYYTLNGENRLYFDENGNYTRSMRLSANDPDYKNLHRMGEKQNDKNDNYEK
jgi:hypothetical protein